MPLPAFDLYQILKAKEGNLFYSPYSISTALAMTYTGARGETEKEVANALHFTLPQNKLHLAFAELNGVLESRPAKDSSFPPQMLCGGSKIIHFCLSF